MLTFCISKQYSAKEEAKLAFDNIASKAEVKDGAATSEKDFWSLTKRGDTLIMESPFWGGRDLKKAIKEQSALYVSFSSVPIASELDLHQGSMLANISRLEGLLKQKDPSPLEGVFDWFQNQTMYRYDTDNPIQSWDFSSHRLLGDFGVETPYINSDFIYDAIEYFLYE